MMNNMNMTGGVPMNNMFGQVDVRGTAVQPGQELCRMWSRGKCWYGQTCKNAHCGAGGCEAKPVQQSFQPMMQPGMMMQPPMTPTPMQVPMQPTMQTPVASGFSVQTPSSSTATLAATPQPVSSGFSGQQQVPTAQQFGSIVVDMASEDVKRFVSNPSRFRLICVEHELEEKFAKVAKIMSGPEWAFYRGGSPQLEVNQNMLNQFIEELLATGWSFKEAEKSPTEKMADGMGQMKDALTFLLEGMKQDREERRMSLDSDDSKRRKDSVGNGGDDTPMLHEHVHAESKFGFDLEEEEDLSSAGEVGGAPQRIEPRVTPEDTPYRRADEGKNPYSANRTDVRGANQRFHPYAQEERGVWNMSPTQEVVQDGTGMEAYQQSAAIDEDVALLKKWETHPPGWEVPAKGDNEDAEKSNRYDLRPRKVRRAWKV
jgi:hypothetical protein